MTDSLRCWCCQSMLAPDLCPVCDMAVLMSPPHACLRSGRVISDEHDCDIEWTPVGPDHETGVAA